MTTGALISFSAVALAGAGVLRLVGASARRPSLVLAGASLVGGAAAVIASSGIWQAVVIVAASTLVSVSVVATRRLGRGKRRRDRAAHGVGRAGVAVAAVGCAGLTALFPFFRLPAPTGPEAVGTRYVMLTDSARLEMWTERRDDVRHVPIQIWYPTTTSEGVVAPYWDAADARSEALAGSLGLPGFVFSHLDRIQTHSIIDAPLAPTPDRLPVLLFSHGYGGLPDQSTFLMEDLASHGYVVVSVGHPFESLPIRTPDGITDFRSQTPDPTPEQVQRSLDLLARLEASASEGRKDHAELLTEVAALPGLERSFRTWVADGLHALAWLDRVDQEGGPFAGRLDVGRIGFFGHSFGGAVAGELCHRSGRCAAGMNLDGAQMGSVAGDGVGAPFLFVYSVPTRWVNHAVAARSPAAAQATLEGSAHFDFTDLPMVTPLLRLLSRVSPIPQAGPAPHEALVPPTRRLVLHFFDRHVRGRDVPIPDAADASAVRFEGGGVSR